MPAPSPSDLEQIRNADVIVGVDEDFGNRFIVYGRDHLEQVRLSNEEKQSSIVLLDVGPKSIPLEQLLDLVAKAKGLRVRCRSYRPRCLDRGVLTDDSGRRGLMCGFFASPRMR